MSLGGPGNRALDTAVNSLIDVGIHVVVSAGNENHDAGDFSPARVPYAITVGASDITDNRADYSNYGYKVGQYRVISMFGNILTYRHLLSNQISSHLAQTSFPPGMHMVPTR
jgi:subtilisin family serine protease